MANISEGGALKKTAPQDKWQIDITESGYSVIPNHVFSINEILDAKRKLNATEMMILLNLLTWWWHRDSRPFPSKALLSGRLGLSTRQIQRALKCLQAKGMLSVIPRYLAGKRRSNYYDLSMFVEMVRIHANGG